MARFGLVRCSRAIGLMTACTLALAACSGSNADGDDVLQSPPADTSLTTTTPPTTEPEAPTTTTEPDGDGEYVLGGDPTLNAFQKSLYAFHREYMVDHSKVFGDQPGETEAHRQWTEDNTIDPYRKRVLDLLDTYEADGSYNWGPGALSSIVAIDWGGPIDPATAAANGVTVTDCLLGRLQLRSSDGEVVGGAGDLPYLFDFDYVYELGDGTTEARWLLKNVRTTEERCETFDTFRRPSGQFSDGIITSNADAEAVRAVHTKFMTDSYGGIDERVHGREATLENAKETAILDAFNTVKALADFAVNQGGYLDGTAFDSNIVAIEVNGTEARVLDCSLDIVAIVDADGNVLEPSGTDHILRQTFLTKVDNQWFVEFAYIYGVVPCNPDDYS